MKKIILTSLIVIGISFVSVIVITNPDSQFTKNNDQWISYIGAITGGFLTLVGVWWTIKEQKHELINQQKKLDNQRRDDLILQYAPIVNLRLCDNIETNNKFYDILLRNASKEDEYLTINFQLFNANSYACTLDCIFFSEMTCIQGICMDIQQQNEIKIPLFNMGYNLSLYNPYNLRIKLYYPQDISSFPENSKYSFKFGAQYYNIFDKTNIISNRFRINFDVTKHFHSIRKIENLKVSDIEISIIPEGGDEDESTS